MTFLSNFTYDQYVEFAKKHGRKPRTEHVFEKWKRDKGNPPSLKQLLIEEFDAVHVGYSHPAYSVCMKAESAFDDMEKERQERKRTTQLGLFS